MLFLKENKNLAHLALSNFFNFCCYFIQRAINLYWNLWIKHSRGWCVQEVRPIYSGLCLYSLSIYLLKKFQRKKSETTVTFAVQLFVYKWRGTFNQAQSTSVKLLLHNCFSNYRCYLTCTCQLARKNTHICSRLIFDILVSWDWKVVPTRPIKDQTMLPVLFT